MADLRISDDLKLPVEVVGESTAILAKKGAGKSNTAKVIVEETLDHGGVQVIVLDPIGHWWSLRAGASGKPRGGYDIAVFGGMHGDLPLEETAGKLLAQTAVESGQSMVLDVSGLESNGAMQRFVYELLEELYRLKQATPTPLLLVLEEADEFAPQETSGKNVPRMVGAANRISKRGRGRGIGMLYVTQRSAALNKNVLDQADTLIVMRTMGPRDRKAIEGWVKHQDAEGMDEVLPSLPSLQTGEAWVWTPQRGLLQRLMVRKARTYDSSWTPKPGEAETVVEVKPIDVQKLGAAIEATVERAKENDPAELRKRVRDLEQRLRDRPAGEPERVEVQVPVEVPILGDEQVELLQSIVGEIRDVAEAVDALRAVADQIESAVLAARPRAEQVRTESVRATAKTRASVTPARRPAPPTVDPGDLSAYAVGLLRTLGERHPMRLSRAQISTFSGRKPRSSAFSAAMAEIRQGGYVTVEGGQHALTEAGIDLVSDSIGAATADVVEMWRAALPSYERDLFDALVHAHPHGLTRPELAERTGRSLTSSAFSAAISTLSKNGLVDVAQGEVRASDDLFIGARA